MSVDSKTGLFFVGAREVATGRVVITPEGPQRYKVEFRLSDRLLSEHPVDTVREGEALIRREIAEVQFTAHEERPHPQAPERKRNRPMPVE